METNRPGRRPSGPPDTSVPGNPKPDSARPNSPNETLQVTGLHAKTRRLKTSADKPRVQAQPPAIRRDRPVSAMRLTLSDEDKAPYRIGHETANIKSFVDKQAQRLNLPDDIRSLLQVHLMKCSRVLSSPQAPGSVMQDDEMNRLALEFLLMARLRAAPDFKAIPESPLHQAVTAALTLQPELRLSRLQGLDDLAPLEAQVLEQHLRLRTDAAQAQHLAHPQDPWTGPATDDPLIRARRARHVAALPWHTFTEPALAQRSHPQFDPASATVLARTQAGGCDQAFVEPGCLDHLKLEWPPQVPAPKPPLGLIDACRHVAHAALGHPELAQQAKGWRGMFDHEAQLIVWKRVAGSVFGQICKLLPALRLPEPVHRELGEWIRCIDAQADQVKRGLRERASPQGPSDADASDRLAQQCAAIDQAARTLQMHIIRGLFVQVVSPKLAALRLSLLLADRQARADVMTFKEDAWRLVCQALEGLWQSAATPKGGLDPMIQADIQQANTQAEAVYLDWIETLAKLP